MKKGLIFTLISLAATALPVTSTMAAKSTANVALTSNYVFRGQTQSNDSLAVQAGYDYAQGKDKGLYAGTFVSTVDGGTNGGSGLEIDVFAGWKGVFGKGNKMGYDVGAKIYNYTDSNFNNNINELIGGISYETAYVKLALGNTSGGNNYEYLDVGASFTVLKDIDLNLRFGHYLSSPNSNDLSAILAKEIDGYNLKLGLTFEDLTPKNNIEFFVTVGKSFDL